MDLKGLLSVFVLVIVGLVLLQTITDRNYEATEMPYDTIVNETNDITGCICGTTLCASTACNYTLAKQNVVASTITVKNATGTSLVLDTDYKVDSTDRDSVKISYLYTVDTDGGISALNNISYIGYDRWQDNYVQGNGSARTMLSLNNIFFAIGIFLFVGGIVFAYMRKEGLF